MNKIAINGVAICKNQSFPFLLQYSFVGIFLFTNRLFARLVTFFHMFQHIFFVKQHILELAFAVHF